MAAIWGHILFLLPGRARDTTLKNLRACFPQLQDQEINSLARESLQSTVATGLEMGKAWLLPVRKMVALIKESEGLEEFNRALKSGDGIILITPHHSNWEIFGQYLSSLTVPTYLYQPQKIAVLDKLLKETRSRNGIKLAPTNRKGVAQLLRALDKGEVVGVLPDQVPTDEGGIYAPFLGVQALTMTLVSKMAKRNKVKVYCGYVERLPAGKGFKAVFREANSKIYDENLEESVAGLNLSVEECLASKPTQYQWDYKRFRRQPDGTRFY